MEEWEFDFEWLRIRHIVKKAMSKKELPDLQSILFLIGIQELGRWPEKFSKEEKQDLMHIAVCTLLESEGIYAFKGRDADGWPHFEQKKSFKLDGVKAQENMLKGKVINYFRALEKENGGFEQMN